VLVGLIQIPPWVREVWAHVQPHLSLITTIGASTALLAVSAALYALIGCFLLHLALRGYWVALVGADSVFPEGVRWDRQRAYGPIQTEIARTRVRPLRTFIAWADNAASLVFATGFVLAASLLSSIVFCLVFVVAVWALTFVLPTRPALLTVAALGAAALLVLIVAVAVDLRIGARIDHASRAGRLLRAALVVTSGATPSGVRSLAAVLTSNVDRRVVYAVGLAGMAGAWGTARAVLGDDRELPGRRTYTFFGEGAREAAVTASHYESLWGDEAAPVSLPSIQSDVITGPYVRLFVPYRPVRHDAALRRACPGLRPPPEQADDASAPAADEAVLACAARLHAVTLDGRAVPGARFRFFTNPRTERRGFLMLIPVSDLAPGEHVLALTPATRDPSPAPPPPIRIPFWR
jgi:hypothetical protein